MIALDALPWPWGEEIIAHLFVLTRLVRPGRWRRVLAWARQQPVASPWRLAVRLCAFLGCWTARARLLGLRGPGDLRRIVVLEGEQHLKGEQRPGAAARGVILLAFHLGPPKADVGLKALGYPVRTVAWWRRDRPGWWSPEWSALFDENPDLAPDGNRDRWLGVLYQARQVLRNGGTIYLMADGEGRELFRVPLPGGPVVIRAGWVNLHRHTGARVLPVLTHREGHTHVIAIHPELPMTVADPLREGAAWRDVLASLLTDYVRRFPEQCFGLAFARER
jgi:hypothetical protein